MDYVLTHPHFLLRHKALVAHENDELVKSMHRIMKKAAGIGLAANQIGNANRIFVYKLPDGTKGHFVNPKIIDRSNQYLTKEGCLSLPGKSYLVNRYENITVQSYNHPTQEYTGLLAQIIQHEIDHLDGILLCDHGELIND